MSLVAIEALQARLAEQFTLYLPTNSTIEQAIYYAMTNGGKRLRPMLVYLTGHAFGATLADLDRPAMAVELIHAYSLVHDDLPAMDDDDVRRGLPTCHKVYGEAMAILAGDAMQALAFGLLANPQQVNALSLIQALAKACGAEGMAGGQALDLAAVGQSLQQSELDHIHRLKTGALIEASMVMGLLCGQASSQDSALVRAIAQVLGLLYQVQDDIFDVDAPSHLRGKQPGGDARLAKPTYPAILGLAGAQQVAQQLAEQLQVLLGQLPPTAQALNNYVMSMINRQW